MLKAWYNVGRYSIIGQTVPDVYDSITKRKLASRVEVIMGLLVYPADYCNDREIAIKLPDFMSTSPFNSLYQS
jgi:hypothetical protein